jgi:cleavage and polyadenylation specificity factor subunit 1
VVDGEDRSNSHGFLILSRADSTMVLQTGQEINELESSGFFTQGPTVFTGNLGSTKYIVQVSEKEIRLLKGSQQIQRLSLDLSSPIIQTSCADPHVLLRTIDGQIVLLTLQADIGMPQLSVIKANLKSKSKLNYLCAYKDVSGLFSTNAVSFYN